MLAAAAALTVALSSPVQVQVTRDRPFSLNVRGGMNVPTFDIADVADPGPSFGIGLKYAVSDRVFLRANGDFGFPPGAELGSGAGAVELPDVDVFHYIGVPAIASRRPRARSTPASTSVPGR